ncbi:MAG: hypothetical protein OHK0029_28520 [Armatimonadaceae bacterium]
MQEQELPGGERLFVPEGARVGSDGTIPLTVHLHGSPRVVQSGFTTAHRPGVLAVLTLPGLSGVYTRHFATNPAGVFAALTQSVCKAVGAREVAPIWLSSFSAGFGGVRELLRADAVHRRLDALILADTLYAGFAQEPRDPADRPPPDPENLKDFVRFARDAALRRDRAMLVTYCDLLPPTYSATRETAEALRQAVGVENQPAQGQWSHGLELTSHVRKGRFATYGFSGEDGPAHMRHLHGLSVFYRLVPRV